MAKVFYLGIVERGLNSSFGVYFPDLPGCVSAANTFEETVAGGQEAIELHIQGMREDGLVIPDPRPMAAFDPQEHEGGEVFRLVMFPVEVEVITVERDAVDVTGAGVSR